MESKVTKRGGVRAGAGRKRGNGKLEKARREWARRNFDDLAESEVDSALIAAATDLYHPQFVAAARLLKEFKHGKPRQQIGIDSSDSFRKWQASIDGILKNGDSEADTSDQADHDAANTVPPVAGTSANPRGA